MTTITVVRDPDPTVKMDPQLWFTTMTVIRSVIQPTTEK